MKMLRNWLRYSQKIVVRWLHFTRSGVSGSLSTSQPRNTRQSSLGNLYTQCSELPLHNFIQITLTDNLDWLLKDDQADLPTNAREIWDAIFFEYMELIGSEDFSYLIELQEEIARLRLKVTTIEASLELLTTYESQPLIKELLDLGYKVDQMRGWDEYFQSLEKIQKRVGVIVMEIKTKESELQHLVSGFKKVKLSQTYFDDILINLSKYMGFEVDEYRTTVSKYASMIRNYQKYVQWQKNG